MPWPMTLAPTNEAIRRENHAEKNLIKKKIAVIQDVRILLLSKSVRFCESRRRKGIAFTVVRLLFLIYRTIFSVNGITLHVLSLSILVLH
jgi:hypothetical protein